MENQDVEIQAITKISDALSSLEADAIQRVLRYITQRYQPKAGGQLVVETKTSLDAQDSNTPYSEFHELYDAARPVSGVERVLVVGYWFQKILDKSELDGFLLNKELKNLGYPSTNITRDLDGLMKKVPRLVTQVRKEGNSQQSRKTYKLTSEGIRAVEKMISANRLDKNIQSNLE